MTKSKDRNVEHIQNMLLYGYNALYDYYEYKIENKSYTERQLLDLLSSNLARMAEQVGSDELGNRKLSDEIKKGHPEVPWRKLYAFRILHDHHYRSIELPNILNTIEDHLPNNLIVIEKIEDELLDELKEIDVSSELFKFTSNEKEKVLEVWKKHPELAPTN